MATTPTPASLALERSRQQTTLRLLRPLAVGVVVLVEVAGSRMHPRPGFSGERLGVLLALLGFALGVAGVVRTREARASVQAPFFLLLVVSAATLGWLQPNGPGFIGVFVAVGAAALRLPGWVGATVAVVALGALAAAGALSGESRSPRSF